MPLPELEELYTLYRTDLYRYLCHLTRDPTEAEDILSETFLRAMRRLPTYRGYPPTAATALSKHGCSALPATSGWKVCVSDAPTSAQMTCWKTTWSRIP